MNQRNLRILVVLIWVGILALVVRRSQPVGSTIEPLGLGGSMPSESWMTVYQLGQRIGFTHQQIRVETEAVTVQETTTLHLKVLGSPQSVTTHLTAVLGLDYSLRRAEFVMRSAASAFHARADRNPEGLDIELDFGGNRSKQQVPLSGDLYLPQALRAMASGGGWQIGSELECSVWDPLTGTHQQHSLRVVANEVVPERAPAVLAWKVVEEVRGMRTTAWVAENGMVWREEGPLGFVLVRSSPDEAREVAASSVSDVDVARVAAVPSTLIESPRSLRRLRIRLLGDVAPRLSDSEQHWDGDELTIERFVPDPIATYVLPARGAAEAELAATVFLQSDHPRVRTLAREILASEKDAQRAAIRLNDWVYEYLEKVPTVSMPNALQVIDMGHGDCNEHAVLFTALARAVGLPARVVAGLVYLDGLFLFHAWSEVWLGRWVSIDPALRQFPADATHIKLLEGGPETHGALLAVVDRIAVDVISAGSM